MDQAALIQLAKDTATKHGLDPVLVCAVCEQESGWDTWAIRMEPAFYRHYVQPLNLPDTEAYARSFSWGLMQCMGEVAREAGFKGRFCSELCAPATGLEFGCRILSSKLSRAGQDITKALLLWNGGSNTQYPSQVQARMDKYR